MFLSVVSSQPMNQPLTGLNRHTCLCLEYSQIFSSNTRNSFFTRISAKFHPSVKHLAPFGRVERHRWALAMGVLELLGLFSNYLQILGHDHVRISCDIFGSIKVGSRVGKSWLLGILRKDYVLQKNQPTLWFHGCVSTRSNHSIVFIFCLKVTTWAAAKRCQGRFQSTSNCGSQEKGFTIWNKRKRSRRTRESPNGPYSKNLRFQNHDGKLPPFFIRSMARDEFPESSRQLSSQLRPKDLLSQRSVLTKSPHLNPQTTDDAQWLWQKDDN